MSSSSLAAPAVVVLVKQVEPNEVTYGPPRTLDSGSKSIPLLHRGKNLVVQTEEMRIPFGIRDGGAFGGGSGADERGVCSEKKTIEFSVDPDVCPHAYEKFRALDDKIIDDAMVNSRTWFRKCHDKRDVLEALYSPIVRMYRDKATGEISDRFPPLIKANLPVKQGALLTEVYDVNRMRVDVRSVDLRGARGVAILQCSGIWIAGGKFGCSWKVLQLRVSSMQSKITGYCFRDDDETDGDANC